MDRYAQYAIVSSDEAVKDANFDFEKLDKDRVGVIWGSGIGGLETFQQEVTDFVNGNGAPKFNPFFIPKMIADIAGGHISNMVFKALISLLFQLVLPLQML